ncbi:MAG: hypothetical protein KIT82_20335 [Bradyrhizobium sp.]|nr:hypothetical protein [Bradyrhizobium sp.]
MRALSSFLFLLAISLSAPAWADDLPSGTIKIVVPFGPGGTGDLAARAIGQKLSESVGRPVIIENSVSAFGIKAAQTVAQSTPDGSAILLGGGISAISPLLHKSLPYDQADFTWVSMIGYFSFVLIVDANSSLKTVEDVIAAAKKDPAEFNFGSIAVGGIPHLSLLLFKNMAGLTAPIVTYRSTGEVVVALKSGQVQVAIEALPGVSGQLQSGNLRAIAVAAPKPVAQLPGVPTISDSGLPGYDVVGWNALSVPAKTPRSIVNRLNREIKSALQAPEVRKKMEALGLDPAASAPEEVQSIFNGDMQKWRAVIEKSDIKMQ